MSPLDLIATVFGGICVVFVWFGTRGHHADTKYLFAFGSGVSAAYLISFIVGILFNSQVIKSTMLETSSVQLLGSLGYTAYVNLKAVWTMMPSGRRPDDNGAGPGDQLAPPQPSV